MITKNHEIASENSLTSSVRKTNKSQKDEMGWGRTRWTRSNQGNEVPRVRAKFLSEELRNRIHKEDNQFNDMEDELQP